MSMNVARVKDEQLVDLLGFYAWELCGEWGYSQGWLLGENERRRWR